MGAKPYQEKIGAERAHGLGHFCLRAGADPVKSGRGAQDEMLKARNVPKASMTNELVSDSKVSF